MRSPEDNLVSGSQFASGILPAGVSITDSANGKLITFSGTTPTGLYRIVITAQEQVVTSVDDPFLQNANLTESTAEKIRLTYKINVVLDSDQTETPVPYTNETSNQNLVNQIIVTPVSGGNGEALLYNNISGSEEIDGRNLEITVRNAIAGTLLPNSTTSTGNPIPNGSSDQTSFNNGTLIDSVGSIYHINAIFNDVTSNQVIIRIDKEFGQPNAQLINGSPYTIQKSDIYVTDDLNGTPQGFLFYPIAKVDWNSSSQITHPSKITDLRTRILSQKTLQALLNEKLTLSLINGGTISLSSDSSTLTWSSDLNLVSPFLTSQTISAGNSLLVDGGALIYSLNLISGGVISKGNLSITSTTTGTSISLSGSPNLSSVNIGNIIKIGSNTTYITAIDNINKVLTVNSSIGTSGSGTIYLDSYASQTALLNEDSYVLAVKNGSNVWIDGLELKTGDQSTLKNNPELVDKLYEDRNIKLTQGGLITFTGTQLQFTENLKLELEQLSGNNINAPGPLVIDLGAGPYNLSANNRMVYAVIDRTAGTATVTDDSTTVPEPRNNREVFLIAKRDDAGDGTVRVYLKNGMSLNSGEVSRLGNPGKSGVQTDSTSTGSNVTILTVPVLISRLTNASLTSISGIPAGYSGEIVVLENKTGNSILINNEEVTATATNRIVTGTSNNAKLLNGAASLFTYDNITGRWLMVSGSGGGNSFTQFTLANNQSSPADITGFLVDSTQSKAFTSEYTISRRYNGTTGGTEDTAFYTNLGTSFNATASATTIQTDGKILIGGSFTSFNGNTRNNLVRLNSSGTEDVSFYTNLGTGFSGGILFLSIQTDGKLVVSGSFTSFNGNTRNSIARLNSDGTEDTSFYTNLGTGFNASILTTAIQSDGKILVGGSFTSLNGSTRNRLVRLNSDGTEDTTFYTNLGTGFNNQVLSVIVQSDNKILVGGGFTSLNGTTRNLLVRLNSDGTIDTTFYTNLGTGFSGGGITVQSLLEQSNTQLVIGGTFTSFNGNTRNRLVRLNSDGTEDTLFYTNLGTAFSGGILNSIQQSTNGSILIGGTFTSFNGSTFNRFLNLNSDGTLNTGFNTNLGTGFGSAVDSISIEILTNQIIISGAFSTFNGNTRAFLVRLADNGPNTELLTEGTIRGFYRPSVPEWDIGGQVSIGDDTGIDFSMTSAGQMQYTSTNLTGTLVESIIRFIITTL